MQSCPGRYRCPFTAWRMPEGTQPAPITWVMAFDLDGRTAHDLRSSDGTYGFVTAVAERDGRLVLGSLQEDTVAVVELPPD